MLQEEHSFDEQVLEQLEPYLAHLPKKVRLVVWADAMGKQTEQAAVQLGETLAEQFSQIDFALRPQRVNYRYYPVLGVMGIEENEEVDYRVRFIGLPRGYLINGLIGAFQAVSFRASNIEPRTRISLSRLPKAVELELFTATENEAGAVMSTLISGLAVASPQVSSYTIMADAFPHAAIRYSVRNLPHTVINRRYHVEGLLDEEKLLGHLARAVKSA